MAAPGRLRIVREAQKQLRASRRDMRKQRAQRLQQVMHASVDAVAGSAAAATATVTRSPSTLPVVSASVGLGAHAVVVVKGRCVGVGGCGAGQLGVVDKAKSPLRRPKPKAPSAPRPSLGEASSYASPSMSVARHKALVLVPDAPGSCMVQVAAGGFHTVALTSTGDVYTWGKGGDGAIGRLRPGWADVPTPTVAKSGALRGRSVQVAAGYRHSAAVTLDGVVHVCGYNADGQLGLGCLEPQPAWTPIPRSFLPPRAVVTNVAAGEGHTVFVLQSGRVLAAGKGTRGELGTGAKTATSSRPVLMAVPDDVHVVGASAGSHHTLLLTAEGAVLACGSGEFGQTGLGHREPAAAPVPVRVAVDSGDQSVPCRQVSAGGSHSAFLTRGGIVLCAGRGADGRTGLGLDIGAP